MKHADVIGMGGGKEAVAEFGPISTPSGEESLATLAQ
jgi:hypothetical protein